MVVGIHKKNDAGSFRSLLRLNTVKNVKVRRLASEQKIYSCVLECKALVRGVSVCHQTIAACRALEWSTNSFPWSLLNFIICSLRVCQRCVTKLGNRIYNEMTVCFVAENL